MFRQFVNDDKGYLRWALENPKGFIVNADEPPTSPDYPMVHRATDSRMTSPKNQNYTTRRYFKVCSNDLRELEAWARRERGRALKPCGHCM
jgi:hypothetical protein